MNHSLTFLISSLQPYDPGTVGVILVLQMGKLGLWRFKGAQGHRASDRVKTKSRIPWLIPCNCKMQSTFISPFSLSLKNAGLPVERVWNQQHIPLAHFIHMFTYHFLKDYFVPTVARAWLGTEFQM